MSGGLSAPGWGSLLTHWQAAPGPLVLLCAAAAGYLLAARGVARWPRRRTVVFLAGLTVVGIALTSGVEVYAEALLSAHMAQHLMLALVAAPMLALGSPVTLALRASRGAGRRALRRILTSSAVKVVVQPWAAAALFAAVMVGVHAPAVYEAALANPALHAAEHMAFLGSGLVFWAVAVGADPLPGRPSAVGRLAVVLASMAPMGLVGAWLVSADRLVYPGYGGPARAFGLSALADQQLAGVLMWAVGLWPLVAAALLGTWAVARREEGRAAAREAYADARRGATAP